MNPTEELLAKIGSVIATLEETNGSPESMLYVFFDMNMDLWSRVRKVLVESKLISICNHYVTLTDDGREMARKINASIAPSTN